MLLPVFVEIVVNLQSFGAPELKLQTLMQYIQIESELIGAFNPEQ